MSEDKPEDTDSPVGLGGQVEQRVMPLQPIAKGRFVPNRIVQMLLDVAPIGMNELACMDFTDQERMQFAQLIGYSLVGFGELSYVDEETYAAAEKIVDLGWHEDEVRNAELRSQLSLVRAAVRDAAVLLFKIHPDDLVA